MQAVSPILFTSMGTNSCMNSCMFLLLNRYLNVNMLPRSIRLFCSKNPKNIWMRNFSTVVPQPQQDETGTANNKRASMLANQDYFRVHELFTVKDMFDAKVHLGHKEVSLHDGMRQFVFGSRLGHIIFDLDITAYHLRKALNFCAHIAYRDGIILFVSHNKPCTTLVEKAALECKEFAYTRNWRHGIITDSKQVFNFDIRLPDLCILFNSRYESGQPHRIIVEASRFCIPVIGIVDSDCNPNLITYPVPGNDDTPSAIDFYCKVFKKAILKGKEERINENKYCKSNDNK